MKSVSIAEFLAGMEGTTDSDGNRSSSVLLWPPMVIGNNIYAMNSNGEIWTAVLP